jgi:rod shape determining protein RodA
MQRIKASAKLDLPFIVGVILITALSVIVLRAIAPSLFPLYFLYLILGFGAFFLLIQTDFEIVSIFSKHLYVASIVLLILPLFIGQVTRGTIRWIPIGALTIQPAEIVRPFLLIFFANFLTEKEVDSKRLIKAFLLLALPTALIVIQPSLGVAVLTVIGFIGVLMASTIKKKYFLWGIVFFAVFLPLIWQVLAPYQKQRILTFIDPNQDPYGTGYNAIQSMISVGSGKLFGRGLGKGVQTQLSFLPERHTDFIFASIAEELGIFGATLVLLGSVFILTRLILVSENARSPSARAFVSGLFLMLFAQTMVHVGMNLGLVPITGVPFPLVSAGGSSFLATMIGLGIALGAKRQISA